MTITTDLWTELQINTGRLAPGARGMARDEAARQYNQANALTPADPDYLYSPKQAQVTAHDVLRFVDIDVPDHREIALTDTAAGPRTGGYAVTRGQVVAAVDQYALVTGEPLDTDALLNALPWA